MENPTAIDSGGSLAFSMENPFSLKFGQIFTGFGIGCGIGIGVGRPIYLGAIPMMQQVMSATRGATDAFSGVGQHVNSSLRKLGMKKIEAGVGCGVGIGHGFGAAVGALVGLLASGRCSLCMMIALLAGIALKPGVVNKIQSSVLQAVTKLMLNMGLTSSLSSIQSVVPGSVQSSFSAWTSTSGGNVQSSVGRVVDLASKTAGSSFDHPKSNGSVHRDPSTHNLYEPHGTSDRSLGTRTEKVLDSFLQSPILKNDEDIEVNEMADKLRKESNVLQVLLKHQQAIQGLMEENQKLCRILVEELKVPPSKIQAIRDNFVKSDYPCSDCFECRRRKRKAGR